MCFLVKLPQISTILSLVRTPIFFLLLVVCLSGFCQQRMDDVQQGKQMTCNGQFLVSEPLANWCIEVSPVLWFCPPPGPGWRLLSGANGESETQPLKPYPQESQAAVVRWGWLLLSSCLLVCSENTPCRGHSSQKPLCDLRKSPWKQWNKSLHWNLESIPVSHRKKIRHRTTKPVVQRNLGRLWLTLKSWKTFYPLECLVFHQIFSSVQPKSCYRTLLKMAVTELAKHAE